MADNNEDWKKFVEPEVLADHIITRSQTMATIYGECLISVRQNDKTGKTTFTLFAPNGIVEDNYEYEESKT